MEKVNILLVDDEPRNLDALEAILASDDYNLLRAEDADRALRLLLDSDQVAAIILDIQMPRMSGIELAKTIKSTKRFREIPIVFLTAYMLEERDVITGYGVGAVDYVTKPFNPQILRHKIAVFAELHRKTRELAELNEKLEQRVQERTADLEKSQAALLAAARQKDEFLAVLAHELRNPLAPLRFGLDALLRAQAAGAAPSKRTLEVMNRQLDHMVRLIDDLLDVSRISRGMVELKKERVDLATVVRNSVESLSGTFDQKGVKVVVDGLSDVHVVADPVRIAQILGNLLHNASKYTAKGGQVRVEMARNGDQVLIRMVDDGMGIPPDQLERVFEMFARVHRQLPTPDRGAGIGLALAQRLAQLHDGNLTASSAGEGRGSTFTLTLPAADSAAVEAASPASALAAPGDGPTIDIVVIEDNEDVAETLAGWLGDFGHRVQTATNGEAGLELVLAMAPDLVLCDIGLPGMDGVEVCKRVRERARDASPLMVALTGWGKDEDRGRTAAAGFDRHLVKPVAPDELHKLLQSVQAQAPDARRARERKANTARS